MSPTNPTNATNATNPMNPMNPTNPLPIECVGVIGLGYVGVSLAAFVGTVTSTILLDIDYESIRALQQYNDSV